MNAPIAHPTPEPLTPAQRDVLFFVAAHVEREGYAPTVREIGAALAITSTNGVHEILERLERKGWIARTPLKARAMRVLHEVPSTTAEGTT